MHRDKRQHEPENKIMKKDNEHEGQDSDCNTAACYAKNVKQLKEQIRILQNNCPHKQTEMKTVWEDRHGYDYNNSQYYTTIRCKDCEKTVEVMRHPSGIEDPKKLLA